MQLSRDLNLPPDIAGRRTAVFGLSGSGKSNTATIIVEGLLAAGEQVVLIDPKGEGWGLLSLANGKPSNLPIIAFGPGGHIETLDESHGPKLADFVFESGRSVVLSLVGFESDQSERRFVAQFLRRLFYLKRKATQRTRTLVVFEEAKMFMPEMAGGGSKGPQAELSGAVQRIALQGRACGLGTLVVDQRPQNVAKSVISQCDTIICHQLTHARDRAALREWVESYDVAGRGQQFLDSLAVLQPGEAWIWSPSWLKIFQRIKVPRRTTFDSGASPDGSARTKVQRAEIDLDKLRGQMTEIVEKAKADDPKELKRQLAELKKQVSKPVAAAVDQTSIDRALAARDRDWQRIVKEREADIATLTEGLKRITDKVEEVFKKACAIRPATGVSVLATVAKVTEPKPAARPAAGPVRTPTPTRSEGSQKLGRCEQAILQVLSQFPDGCERGKLTLLAGYSYSGSFQNALGALRTAGLISGSNNGTLKITVAGLDCGPFDSLPTGQALIDYWLTHPRFGKCERMILAALIQNPRGLTKEELCQATEYSYSGSFQNSLGALRTAGLITGRNSERMTAAQSLLDQI